MKINVSEKVIKYLKKIKKECEVEEFKDLNLTYNDIIEHLLEKDKPQRIFKRYVNKRRKFA